MSDHFGPGLFRFLKDLKKNNSRLWFNQHKPRYESEIKEPLLAFISAVGPGLKKIAPHLLADPRPVGGSMFRIYRDVRFSSDKSPYKTHAAAQFRHVRGKTVHAPGFYLHLEPGNVFTAGGLWRPEPDVLVRIREALVKHSANWKKAISGGSFKAHCYLDGESLKRTPRGFEDAPESLLGDLRRKDFCWVEDLSESQACKPGFMKTVLESFARSAPMMKFLTLAMGMEW